MGVLRCAKKKLFRKMDRVLPGWLSTVLKMQNDYESEV
jgi:hypothetical protein